MIGKQRIGLVHPHEKAFYPESSAYMDYFSFSKKYELTIYTDLEEAIDNSDILIYYCGFYPFWKRKPRKLILEYHSLSIGRLGRFKNIMKRVLNKRADGYIFLNENVREGFFFSKKENYKVRGMGFFSFDTEIPVKKEFDIVYAGTFNRRGVSDTLLKLAKKNFKLLLVGCTSKEILSFHSMANVTCYGKLPPDEVVKLLSKSKFGLNIMPNTHPLNIQESTKVIEYCGLGIGVITNRYEWVDHFEKSISGSFIDIEYILKMGSVDELDEIEVKAIDMSQYAWSDVIQKSDIESLISS